MLIYAYDNDDNITGITNNVNASNSRTFGYDARGRLSQTLWQSGSFAREDIIHDANGNRTAVERRIGANDNTPAQTDSYTRTAGTNKLASIDSTFGTRSIQYDARGNTLGETRSGGISVTTGYDGYGRLTSLTRTGEEDQTNIYNGMDERVVVTATASSGTTTTRQFVYDPDGRVLCEYGSSALDVIAERIWMNPEVGDPRSGSGAGSGMFGGDDGTPESGGGGYTPIAIVTGTTLAYVHANHMGVPQLYTDAAGTIIATPNYTLPGFPGQFRTFADLYYNKYRDYDVSTGRYIQADPIGLAGGQSPYSYAMGNPLRYSDPSGLVVWPTSNDPSGFRPPMLSPNGGKQPTNWTQPIPPMLRAPKNPCPEKQPPPPKPPSDWCGSQGFNVPDGNWGSACKIHDECYAARGANKERCDALLAVNMSSVCALQSGGNMCTPIGFVYGAGLMIFGIPNPIFQPARDAFNDAQRGN